MIFIDIVEYVEKTFGVILWPYQKQMLIKISNERNKGNPIIFSSKRLGSVNYDLEQLRELLLTNRDNLENEDSVIESIFKD